MELRYYINTTQISEPIGFDDFKTILKRTEQHGVSAESSVGELEFDGVGFGLIQTAYNTDIDIELIFKAEIKCIDTDDWTTLYTGILDLSTYEETYSDYCGCKVKVGEIGVKTTFNNRVDTVVDIARLTSLDGDVLSAYSNIDKEIIIPAKGLLFRSKTSQSADAKTTFNVGNVSLYVHPSMDTLDLSEDIAILTFQDNTISGTSVFNFTNNEKTNAIISVYLDISIKNTSTRNLLSGAMYITAYDGNTYTNILTSSYDPIAGGQTINKVFNNYVLLPPNVQISVQIIFPRNFNDPQQIAIEFTTRKGSYIKIESIDMASDTTSKVSLIHETLSRLTEIYSGLTVRSDFYGRNDSQVNPLNSGVGDGSMKAITSGLKLRKSTLVDNTEPKIETSFKDLFLSLNAVDNIGWGFTSAQGLNYIRVENWKWFYSAYEIMTINNPANKKRRMRDDVFTRLKIGYNKYGGQDDINSIDTFHTNLEFASGIKAIDKQNTQLSKLIADPYAIEFTRRKALEKTTKDWKYDEDLFLFCLRRDNCDFELTYGVEQGVSNSDITIISPETMTNFRISPKRNALRWADRLFELNSAITTQKYTAGVGNVIAKGKPTIDPCFSTIVDSAGEVVTTENGDIAYVEPHLKPELIEFEYPLTLAEYEDIKAEPYGQIIVDGEPCYIKEIIREVMTGMCDFKLIPKF